MNKKGQLLEKPFIFIFTVVVGALIFIFGFYLINNLMKASNCGQLGLFVNDLKNEVERYYNFDIGSSTDISLKLPRNIKHVCFYTKENYINKAEFDKIDKGLFEAVNNLDYNVIFLPLNYCTKGLFSVKNLKPAENPVCILNTGTIKLNLENKGEYIQIS